RRPQHRRLQAARLPAPRAAGVAGEQTVRSSIGGSDRVHAGGDGQGPRLDRRLELQHQDRRAHRAGNFRHDAAGQKQPAADS
nr:hypothetical protein [Tanacetum cinerariifolium]